MRGKNTGVIAVRGLDTDIITGLEQAASRHDRTREGEARAAIRAWVQPELSAVEHTLREQGERLTYALRQVQQIPEAARMTPSRVAELIGEEKPSEVVSAFHGENELSFRQLEEIADLFGTSPQWMKHGTGSPFPTQGMMEIGCVDDLFQSERNVSRLHLIRTSDETGNLYVVREFNDSLNAELYSTRYHISEEVGSGGFGDLCRLFPIFKTLFRERSASFCSYLVNPMYVHDDEYRGMIHPLVLKDMARRVPWVDDIWDNKSQTRNNEHWPGMIRLREQVLSSIDINKPNE